MVRREHVFSDSFHQLRSRTPEELKYKLSVQFSGEEGIDAGGVSREWYQVRWRGGLSCWDLHACLMTPTAVNRLQPNPNRIPPPFNQVMAREIFNPNLALFVSVPEGGSTFQPNPNSIVQNDMGVSHLSFFT
jgi:hypothetical protein